MKKLFAIILSLSLIIGPVPVARASGGGAGGIAKQILGIANGIVGSAVITKCKLASTQASILVYMAGSLVFVAAEIAGGKKKNQDSANQAQSLDQMKAGMKEGGDYQMAAIDAQIKNEKSNLEFIEKRRKWMMATKAIYAAATALAVLEIWWSFPPPAGIAKPFEGACAPDPSHKPIVSTIAMAYSSLMASGGNLKGMAMGMGMQMAVKWVLKEFFPKVTIGAEIADKAVGILSTAPGRIAFFAAATALVMMIDSELAKEEKDTKKKIADLEKVKESFKLASQTDNELAEGSSNNNAAAGNNKTETSDPNDPSKKTYEIKDLAKGTELQKQCFAKIDGAMHYSAEACKSSFKLTRPKFQMNMDLPTLKTVSNLATDMGQSVSDGDMGKADLAAGELASMAGRMDAVKDGLMKKLNDQLKAQGKKPIDVNGELNRQVTALNDALNKQNPGSGNYSLASMGDMGSMDLKGSEASLAAVDPKAGDVTAVPDAKAPDATGVEVPSATSDVGAISEDALGVANAEEALGVLGAQKLEDNMANFESAEGDISKDSDVSLFKQVSNRYFLNYTKIFQRKEINPPLAEPAPSN